jgi:hypothetical protein
MYISQESPSQTHARLAKVLAAAELVVHERPYAFVEADISNFPTQLIAQALAFVRDEDVWSALVPSSTAEQEQFVVFGFHFTPGLDNSGFVGWLASHLKSCLGTGVMILCGQNTNRGGIFDHWGAPWSLRDAVVAELHRLRSGGQGS